MFSEQCVGESVVQSTLLKVHLEVDASTHMACCANGAHDDLGMCYRDHMPFATKTNT